MFEVLVESSDTRRTGIGPRVVSFSLHGMALLFAALGWHRRPDDSLSPPRTVPITIFEEPSPRSANPGAGNVIGATVGPAPVMPAQIPTAIPSVPVETTAPAAPVTVQTMVGRQLWGVHPGGTRELADSLHLAGEVDEPVQVIRGRQPVYPPALAAAGINGIVRLEFVVDTAGRGERGSVRVMSSSAAAFEQAAIDAVMGSEYRAARVRGQTVRQLVQQQIVFRVP